MTTLSPVTSWPPRSRLSGGTEFEAIFRSLPDAVVHAGPDRTIVQCNPAVRSVFGYEPEDLLGLPLATLLADPLKSDDAQVLGNGSGATARFERAYRRSDGSIFIGETVLTLLDGPRNESGGHIAIIHDVSNRLETDQALRRSEERFRLFIEHAPAAVAMFDREMRYLAVSRRWVSDYGLHGAEIVGRSHYDVFPDTPPRWKAAHMRALENGSVERGDDDAFPRADGTLDWVRWEVRPWWQERGRVGGLIMFMEDVTEKKQARDELDQRAAEVRQTKEALEAQAVELTRTVNQLRQARHEAETAVAAKNDFLARVSHEVRAPINGVLGMADLLLDTELSGEQWEYAQTIRSGGQALVEIINDLLDLSQMEADATILNVSDFDLETCLENAFDVVAPAAASRGLRLTWFVADDVPLQRRGDGQRLRQILVNLLSNAVKFTSEGAVDVEVTADGADLLRFAVRDTGPGVSEADALHLFDAFYRPDNEATRTNEGTGLGLAISRGLTEAMGGRIWLLSNDSGATFYFTARLPEVVEPIWPLAHDGPYGDVAAAAPRRVLVLDDHAPTRRMIASSLRRLGAVAREVDSSEEAELALAERNWDLVLADEHYVAADEGSLVQSADNLVVLRRLGRRGTAFVGSPPTRYLNKPVKRARLAELLGLGGQSAQQPRVPAGRVLRVLVAEDNRLNQIVLTKLLERLGHQVVVVASGAEAVDAVETAAADDPFDVVLLDVLMPGMSGLDAARSVRRRLGESAPRLVAVTAGVADKDRTAAAEAGMDGFLAKPLTLDGLRAALAAE